MKHGKQMLALSTIFSGGRLINRDQNIHFEKKCQIYSNPTRKILENKQLREVLLYSFYLNGHILNFIPPKKRERA